MRVKRNSKRNSENESVASSVGSTDSFGLFGRGCSDLSDCEDEKHNNEHTDRSSESSSHMSCGAVDREKTSLLHGQVIPNGYKAINNHSDVIVPADIFGNDIIKTLRRTSEMKTKIDMNKQSSLVTIFSVWNTIMGSSLLTIAWGIERAGLPVALILLIGMAGLCLYTAYLLIEVNARHGSSHCEVPALCRALLGWQAAALAHAFSLLVLCGACAVYWVLISNFMYYTLNNILDITAVNATTYNTSLLCPKHDEQIEAILPIIEDPSPYWGLHTTVPLYVAIFVFPLLNFTNVSFFTKFNSLGTLSALYLITFVVVKGSIWGLHVDSLPPLHFGKDAAVLSGMLAMSFYIHNIIVTIMSNNARQEKNGRDLSIAFLLVTLTYTLVGTIFYVCFPLAKSCIEDNLLNNFEMHDTMTALARAVLLFQVITVFPLVAFMLRTEAIMLLPVKSNQCLVVTINVTIVILCILVACFCPSIGTIIRYTGAASGLVHVFALPSLLHMRSLYLRKQLTVRTIIAHSTIIIFGTVNLLMQFFIQ